MKAKNMNDVFEEVAGALPHLITRLRIDRSWVWIAGTDKVPESDREKLKQIGFRFKKGDPHPLDGGEGSHWGHACGKSMFKRRNSGPRQSGGVRRERKDENEIADALAALGL